MEVQPSLNEQNCAICLNTFSHPIKLNCSHEFCFLCIKGAYIRNGKCPLCRTDIPSYCMQFQYLNDQNSTITTFNGMYWFYKSRSDGWWLYDELTSQEIEANYTNGMASCEVMISGFVYVIDFVTMKQYRKDEPSVQRDIKRDHNLNDTKGIAGLVGAVNM